MKHHASTLAPLAALIGAIAAPAGAQLDPLLFLKGTRPHVLVALDLSSRMLQDHEGRYYDPMVFDRTSVAFETSLGLTAARADRAYRRSYVGLSWHDPAEPERAEVRAIEVVGDRDAGFDAFDSASRLGRARTALTRAVQGNSASVRFGLVTTRRANPRFSTDPWTLLATAWPSSAEPTDSGTPGRWRAGLPVVDGPASGVDRRAADVGADAPGANEALLRLLARDPGQAGALLPAGFDRSSAGEAPIALLLDDMRAEVERLISSDASCCNTVAVLIAAGGDSTSSEAALAEKARAFLNVAGRRVPVHVVALAPRPADVTQLRAVAAASGGGYTEITADMLNAVNRRDPVPQFVAALNFAVQHALAAYGDLNMPPSLAQPLGQASFFPTASPVVGTLNLENGSDAAGNLLPNTRVLTAEGNVVPQPSNVLLNAGFEMPGFLGRVTAFRVHRPVPDASRPSGYRFSADGTRLWSAAVPSAEQRNIFAIVPGIGLVPFRTAAADLLSPYLAGEDPLRLIEYIRARPLGPVLNSTPALLGPPAGWYADADYAAFEAEHRQRRTLVFVGADDGMMHALDARTGLEVWAVIPYNLLPKLRLLRDGLPVDRFPYFVDGAARLADAKVGGRWRTFLLFGEGPGGTFYQAFDVTLDGIESVIPADRDNPAALLAWFADPGRIPFRWSFPRYEQFDPTLPPDGDLRASASDAEKSVGETWSTPAVGKVGGPAGTFVAIVGSGRLPRSRERQPNRGGVRAGTRVYLLDLASGTPLDSRDVGSDGVAEEQDDCRSDSCARHKNALHADPLAVADTNIEGLTHAYQGDLDGRLWRFDLATGAGPPAFAGAPRLVMSAGADQPIFGTVARLAGSAGQAYLFLATGSDLLPRVGVTGSYRLLGAAESSAGVSSQFEHLLGTSASGGWDEGVSGPPAVDGAAVFFTTTRWRAGGGCTAPEATLYGLTLAGGTAYRGSEGRRREGDPEPVLARVAGGRATGPTVADRHLYFGSGAQVQILGDPENFAAGPGFRGIRIISWREVR